MDKYPLLHPYNGILLNDVLVPDKEEWTIDTHNKMHKSKMLSCQVKKVRLKQYHLDDILERAKLQA